MHPVRLLLRRGPVPRPPTAPPPGSRPVLCFRQPFRVRHHPGPRRARDLAPRALPEPVPPFSLRRDGLAASRGPGTGHGPADRWKFFGRAVARTPRRGGAPSPFFRPALAPPEDASCGGGRVPANQPAPPPARGPRCRRPARGRNSRSPGAAPRRKVWTISVRLPPPPPSPCSPLPIARVPPPPTRPGSTSTS